MLAPGYYLWRKRTIAERAPGHLLAIICCLALLFPVVSASDDLRAVNTETEEAGGKRITKGRESTFNSYQAQPPFCHASSALLPIVLDVQGTILLHSVRLPQLLDLSKRSGRGPPVSPILLRDTQKIQIFCS